MESIVEIIESFALIGTLIITIVNLFVTRALSHSQQQTEVMTKMRSERIVDMRRHSAGIITCCQYLLHDLADKDTKRELLHHCHSLISLLQYYHKYKSDINLITATYNIVELCLADELDKHALQHQMKSFWWLANVYVGADFERLKNESMGKINEGGLSRKEATDFAMLYNQFDEGKLDLFPNSESIAP